MTESEHSTFSDRCADLVTTHPVFRCDHTAMADGCYFCVQSSGPSLDLELTEKSLCDRESSIRDCHSATATGRAQRG